MFPANNPDTSFYKFVYIAVAIVLLAWIVGFCLSINDFLQELKHVNYEIQRTYGSERRRWIRKRRKLWLALFLFIKY